MYLTCALLFLAGAMVTGLLLPGLMGLIARAGFLRPNYKNDLVPVSTGLVFFLASLVTATLFYFFLSTEQKLLLPVFLLVVASFTCLGLLDDVWGSAEVRGLAGHLKSLSGGKLTTGAIKALGGVMTAVLAAVLIGSWQWVPVNTLVIALSANAVNQLDLRPGRAAKGFLLVAIVLFILGRNRPEIIFLAIVSGSLVAYMGADLKAQTMMGDAGANALGGVLGLVGVWVLDERGVIIYLVFLLLYHVVTEKYSLTSIIRNNRFLDYLDRLGREKR